MQDKDLKSLKKRYCLWLYKVTKDELDRIERKFTQLDIDRPILKELKKKDRAKRLEKFILDFQAYIRDKEKDGLSLKFEAGQLNPKYEFLLLKLKAIEKTAIKELGNKGLAEIKSLYEEEMRRRILQERQVKT